MIEDEDRAADDGQPPAANDNGEAGTAPDRRDDIADRPIDRPADGTGRVRTTDGR